MQGGPFGFKNRAFRECNFGLQIGWALEVREKSFCPRRFYQTVVSTKEPIPHPAPYPNRPGKTGTKVAIHL